MPLCASKDATKAGSLLHDCDGTAHGTKAMGGSGVMSTRGLVTWLPSTGRCP